MLTGRVVMDDGTPPPERAAIERICNGRSWKEGYADTRGYFSITIGGNTLNPYVQDASSSEGGFGDPNQPGSGGMSGMQSGFPGTSNSARNLFGCELRATMPGTISEVIELSDRANNSLSDPNVGTIVLHRIGKVDGASVSITSLKAPKSARKDFDHARKELKKQHFDKAEADLTRAVAADTDYAEAWSLLSEVYLHGKQYDKAADAAQRSIAADSRYVNPYFTLITVAANRQDWKKTEELSDKLLALDAYHYPAAYYFNSLASLQLHELDKAQKSILLARKFDVHSSLPKISLLLGQILMQRNDYAGAVQAYKAFLEREPQGPASDYARSAMNAAQTRLAAATPPPK
jgi:tetratricopeptide (TPR) repeat protein